MVEDQFRPSSALLNTLGIRKKGKQKLEEEFSMYDDAKNDDDLEEITEDINAEDSGDLEL